MPVAVFAQETFSAMMRVRSAPVKPASRASSDRCALSSAMRYAVSFDCAGKGASGSPPCATASSTSEPTSS